jgi:hypothetical protein
MLTQGVAEASLVVEVEAVVEEKPAKARVSSLAAILAVALIPFSNGGIGICTEHRSFLPNATQSVSKIGLQA